MVTRLAGGKRIRRRIGGLIVEVDETHVTVCRARHKGGVRVAHADLVAAGDQVRPPRGWIPQIGETVAVLENRHRATVKALVPALPEIIVRVRFPGGTEKSVYSSRLVPVESETLLVRCERTPKEDDSRRPASTLF